MRIILSIFIISLFGCATHSVSERKPAAADLKVSGPVIDFDKQGYLYFSRDPRQIESATGLNFSNLTQVFQSYVKGHEVYCNSYFNTFDCIRAVVEFAKTLSAVNCQVDTGISLTGGHRKAGLPANDKRSAYIDFDFSMEYQARQADLANQLKPFCIR